MNLLDVIKSVLSFQDWKQASSLPGWRPRPPRMKKARIPFMSSRVREIDEQRMTIEEFSDKELRNERFRELRRNGTPHVNKFSTIRNNKSVWCVVRP